VHTAQGGQRVATLVIYLNDVVDGGETTFPEAGISVEARQGGDWPDDPAHGIRERAQRLEAVVRWLCRQCGRRSGR
jgi:hypothetical protein